MADQLIESEREPILVLCHSILHNAFRGYPNFKIETVSSFFSARAILNFIIERQAELPEGQFIAVTSKKVFNSFLEAFQLESKSGERYEMVELLRSIIFIVPDDVINELNIDETVIALADILYTRSKYKPVILVTDISSKREMVEKFYIDSLGDRVFKEKGIPFEIYDTSQTLIFLKARFGFE